MHVMIGATRLELTEGDIALQDTEAVVTAAHWDLLGGQGTDGSVHGKGGPDILAECRKIGGCPIGGAVITGAGRLKARYVIHAVGPVYDSGDEYEQDLLAWAYRNSLLVAVENDISTVSFPSISTGAFVYPLRDAAPIAMQTIVDFLRTEPHSLTLVRFVLYPDEQKDAYGIYASALRKILADSPE